MSTTRAVTALAVLIHASQQRKQTATGVAVDVDRAGMLLSPEIAAELDALRKQVAELDGQAPRLRTDELTPGAMVVAKDMTRFTVDSVTPSAVDWRFNGKQPDGSSTSESGMEIVGHGVDGEPVYFTAAQSHMWYRDFEGELDRLRSLMNAEPAELTEAQIDALAAAGNRAVNNEMHEHLCMCDAWPKACVSSGKFFEGYWDTSAFDTGMPAVIALWEVMRNDRNAAKVAELRAELDERNRGVQLINDDAVRRAAYEARDEERRGWESRRAVDNVRFAELRAQVAELQTDLDRRSDDVMGACLARWDEEQTSARLRLALKSAQRGRQTLRARVAELEAAPLYLAEYDGMAPELHRTLDGAKAFVADGASADMKSIPGRAWDLIEDEDGVLQMAWTDPDTDAPLAEGPGRVTPMRAQGADNTAPDVPEPSPLCDCYSAENPALPHDPKCSNPGGGA